MTVNGSLTTIPTPAAGLSAFGPGSARTLKGYCGPFGRWAGMNERSKGCDGARPKAVLFDVDGTLVDTNDLHAAAWREAFLKFGLDKPIEEIRWQIGKGGDNLIPSLFPDLSEPKRAEMEAFRGDLFKRDYLPRATPFPGVRALFERIAADGTRIVLASSSHSEEVDYHLSLIA